MRRVYIFDMLGLGSAGAKFFVFVILFCCAGYAGMQLWKNRKSEEGKAVAGKVAVGLGIAAVVVLCGLLFFRVIPAMKANSSLEKGNYQQAIEAYDRLNMYEQKKEAMRLYSEAAAAEGNYDLAIEICEELYITDETKVNELKLAKAKALLEQGELEAAADTVAEILSFPEAARFVLDNPVLRDAVFTPGRAVALAHSQYVMDTWYVAVVEDGRMMLATTDLDDRAYAYATDVFSWEDSSVREELRIAYEERYDDKIRNAILLTENENLVSDHGQILQGKPTEDYLFILDADELPVYLRDVADIFQEERCWTRNPVDGEANKAYLASLIKWEDGSLTVTLYSEYVNYGNPILAVMWVDMEQLLLAWAE